MRGGEEMVEEKKHTRTSQIDSFALWMKSWASGYKEPTKRGWERGEILGQKIRGKRIISE